MTTKYHFQTIISLLNYDNSGPLVRKDYLLEKENTMFDPTFRNVNASFISIENDSNFSLY